MNSPRPKLRRDTRVFISAVSRELGSVRKLVKKGLEDNDYHAVEQDNFPTDYRQLVDKLRERIASCDAVVHIAGRCFGAEPQQRPDGVPRRSYTQLEYDLAVELGKPVYVFLTGDGFPADPHEPEPEELRLLQATHCQFLSRTGQDYSRPETRGQLDQKIRTLQLKVETLQEELTTVDVQVAATSSRLSQRFAIVAMLVVVLAGGLCWIAMQKTIFALTDPAALAATIRTQIHTTAEKKIESLPDEKGRWQKVAEIEKERDIALGRVDDLIKLIREGLKEGASPVFQRAAEIMQKEGTDAALAYLESSRHSTLETARRHAARTDAEKEQRNKTLQALVLEAELLETKLRWQPALQLREQVTELAPDWFEARNYLGMLLQQLAR
ncbi:MAG: DUF4062 domain-containing protein, partial [Candidatus Saccharimonas sp.]|nr:DUF4062 domain-containing protein [Planctomycetaceae bacterium]